MEPQPKDVTDMVTVMTSLDIAEGAIEAREEQLERRDEDVERLARGDFHVSVEGVIPRWCIDGRPGAAWDQMLLAAPKHLWWQMI
ncbi:hypothetical protein D3C72_1367640 [compost metagenome]